MTDAHLQKDTITSSILLRSSQKIQKHTLSENNKNSCCAANNNMPSSINHQQRSAPNIPKAYAATLLLGVAMIPFIISLQGSLSLFFPSNFLFLSRSLSFHDIEKYSTLQDVKDIDPSIESRAIAKVDIDNCSNVFLYLPERFSDHGHGSQINTYIEAILVGTYLNRRVLIVDPPNERSHYAGASQFGCPVDAFEEIHMNSTASWTTSSDNWQIKENFPGGLSRLIDHPKWLTGGCPIPCADTYTYKDWFRFSSQSTSMSAPITCKGSDGRTFNVMVTGGSGVRPYFYAKAEGNQFISSERWAMNLGATPEEAKIFSTLSGDKMWDYAIGLIIKAGFLRFQPWIARDVETLIQSFDLFQRIGASSEVYDAIHVRRGDKLISEARNEVNMYWRSKGYKDMTNLPANYIPFAHYLSQFRQNECPMNEQGKVTKRMKRIVYVATDDPVVVKDEIANLPYHIDEQTILWEDCQSCHFILILRMIVHFI